MKIIDFKTSNYFTGMPSIFGFVAGIIGVLLLVAGKFTLGGINLVVCIIALTTHYRLSINFDEKRYSEYIKLLGINTGVESHTFEKLHYIFIKKKKARQTMNSRIQSTTIEVMQYDAFLKVSEDDKIHLMTFETKDKLLKKLTPIAAQLGIEIVDYSIEEINR